MNLMIGNDQSVSYRLRSGMSKEQALDIAGHTAEIMREHQCNGVLKIMQDFQRGTLGCQ